MAKNVAQVFSANPITTIGSTDLIYVVQSGTTDAAISGASLNAFYSPIAGSSSIVTVGTITSGIWHGTAIDVAHGGTGNITFTPFSIICAGTTATGIFQNVVGVGTLNQVLVSQGAGALPIWSSVPGVVPAAMTQINDTNVTLTLGGTPATSLLQAVSLTMGWSGQLAETRGGTNQSTYILGDTLYASAANTLSKLAGNITSVKQYLSQTGTGAVSAAPAWATISGGDITGAALTKTDDTNVTLTLGGTPTTALLRAASLTLGWTGQLSVARGGTGLALATIHNLLIGNGTTALTLLAPSATSGVPLISQGASSDPAFGTAVVAGGGTGNTTFTAYSVICAGTTATGVFQNVVGVGSANQVLTSNGAAALPTWQSVPGLTPAAMTQANDTNVTLTLGGTPATSLLQAVSLTMGWTGQLGLTRGGTAASLTASNGGILYSTASALAILAGTATANQVLLSGASTTPAWSTAIYPSAVGSAGVLMRSNGSTGWVASNFTVPNSTTVNQILFSSSTNNVTGLATANSSILVTNGSGVPAWGTTLPSFTTGTITFSPTTGGLVGTTTNDNASAGNVGEFISSVVTAASPLTITSATNTTLTSVSLTAGDWDVWANSKVTGTTIINFATSISIVNNTQAAPELVTQILPIATSTTCGAPAPSQRLSLSGTTTVYIVTFGTGTGTITAAGGIYARRAR